MHNLISHPSELIYINNVPFVIWCYWEGDAMEGNRLLSFQYLQQHISVPICLITPDNLNNFIKPNFPILESYQDLSIVHRSDYVRAYLMHHYGGGWHDIKATEQSYAEVWSIFEDENIWIVGRKETAKGAAKVYTQNGDYIPNFYKDLIAVPSWVARPNTKFSEEMLEGIESIINSNKEILQKYPAKHPREKKLPNTNFLKKVFNIAKFLYQKRSLHYPLDWTLFGNVFHPLILKYKGHISYELPTDQHKNAGIYHRS